MVYAYNATRWSSGSSGRAAATLAGCGRCSGSRPTCHRCWSRRITRQIRSLPLEVHGLANRREPDLRIAAVRRRVSQVCIQTSDLAPLCVYALDSCGGDRPGIAMPSKLRRCVDACDRGGLLPFTSRHKKRAPVSHNPFASRHKKKEPRWMDRMPPSTLPNRLCASRMEKCAMAGVLDLPRSRGEMRAWDHALWLYVMLSSGLVAFFGSAPGGAILPSRPAH